MPLGVVKGGSGCAPLNAVLEVLQVNDFAR